MNPLGQLALATLAFLATHFVSSTPLRPALVRAMGEWPYRILYSVVALATFVWMCMAYNAAPRDFLWTGLRHAPLVLVPLAFVLVACGGGRRNPTAAGAEKLLQREDAVRGITRITRHPIMWGIALWAAAHVAARGDLKSTVFFGGLLFLAIAGTLFMDRRKAATFGEHWGRFAAQTSNVPFVAVAQGRNRIAWREIGWVRPLAGLVVAAAFFLVHSWLFGARPY